MAIKEPMAPKAPDEGKVAGERQSMSVTLSVKRFLISHIAGVLNPFVVGHAGSRRRFKFAVVHHQGRRSGRPYATPTSARPISDGFVVPMTFGEGADWVRNVLAAGGCVLDWEGVQYNLVEPEVIDLATARSAFSRIERLFLPVIGIKQLVRLRFASLRNSPQGL